MVFTINVLSETRYTYEQRMTSEKYSVEFDVILSYNDFNNFVLKFFVSND
jgi:hypothetical protein